MDVLIKCADLPWYWLACQGSLDGPAIGMSERQNRFHSQHRRTIFQAGDGVRGSNIADHPHHEDMTNALVENKLNRKPRVSAGKHGAKRLLVLFRVSFQNIQIFLERDKLL